MADTAEKEENPFDALAKVILKAESYEDAYKKVWTAMKTGELSEDTVVSILLTASTMPALAAANIQMEKILKDHGFIKEESEPEATAEVPNTIQFPNGEKVS